MVDGRRGTENEKKKKPLVESLGWKKKIIMK